MSQQLKINREVNIEVDREGFRASAKELGERAAGIFTGNQKSQMKNLENITNSAHKMTDVLNFIKRQTGKAKAGDGWKRSNFGQRLLEQLEMNVERKVGPICQALAFGEGDAPGRMDIKLRLAREYIRQLVVHYEYRLGDDQ